MHALCNADSINAKISSSLKVSITRDDSKVSPTKVSRTKVSCTKVNHGKVSTTKVSAKASTKVSIRVSTRVIAKDSSSTLGSTQGSTSTRGSTMLRWLICTMEFLLLLSLRGSTSCCVLRACRVWNL